MSKDIVTAGILGGVVMFVCLAAGRIFLPDFDNSGFRMLPDQVPMQAALKERIKTPGTYVCPYLPPNQDTALFPDYWKEPVFTITYTGYTHSTVPGFGSIGVFSFLLAPLAAGWLLSQASDRVLATFSRRWIFVTTLGLFVAVSSDLLRALTDEQKLPAVAVAVLGTVITWLLIGLVLAWRIRPRPTVSR